MVALDSDELIHYGSVAKLDLWYKSSNSACFSGILNTLCTLKPISSNRFVITPK
jgi:hypothetical protein